MEESVDGERIHLGIPEKIYGSILKQYRKKVLGFFLEKFLEDLLTQISKDILEGI